MVYRGLTRAGVAPGAGTLVIGDGTIALLAVYPAATLVSGEIVLVGRRAAQADLARAAGGGRFELRRCPGGRGYRPGVEAAGATTAAATAFPRRAAAAPCCCSGCRRTARPSALALDDVVNNDLAILGSFSYTSAAWRDVVTLLNAGLIGPRIPRHAPVPRSPTGSRHCHACAARRAAGQGTARGQLVPLPSDIRKGTGQMTFTSVNPHDPADVLGEWEAAGSAGAQAAVDRAVSAAPGWRDTPGAAGRRRWPMRPARWSSGRARSPSLVVREVGKPVSEARGEVARGVAILRYYAQAALRPTARPLPAAAADQLLMARHVPVGVAALLTPWNFPVAIPLWKAAPSLAYGNATMLKPSSAAAATALLLGEISAPACPPTCSRSCSAAPRPPAADRPSGCGRRLVHRLVRGRQADQRPRRRRAAAGCRPRWAARTRRWCSPTPIWSGPPTAIAYAAMGYAGQKCTATSRVIVVREVYPISATPWRRDRGAAASSTRPTRRRWSGRSSTPGRGTPRWPRWQRRAAGC